jgi:glutamine amidotransferase
VLIVDYGLGNLHSVAKSFEYLGCDVEVSADASALGHAERVVLPGVGAFADGMAGLRRHGQDEALLAYAESGRPLLGICLGAQLLLDESEEFGLHRGLGIIPGRVIQIPAQGVKVPHVGWARLQPPPGRPALTGIMGQFPAGGWTYFIHSYHMVPPDPQHLAAVCQYGPQTIAAAVEKGWVFGLQFHPEKSGEAGLEILRAFTAL